ncbi:hypothetical protein FISHEDRAFT_72020 [Fistulina hepatica ATCC 64428]|uniref:Uncharacterized protein n=1 Tax=Fistulina hepatica ATCC 64428 TaxID=1128425 RepID=A0A0D7AFL9_9AGAR|nr:hypothetical protein FISHEDRAFT_72020 [Fistulina hepatica ATCC 64428]
MADLLKAPSDGVIVFVPDKDGSRCPVFLPNNPPRVDHRLLASDMLVWQVLRDRVPVEFARSVGIDSHHAQYWVISSPNVDYIPEPIMGPRTVVACLDGCYAADDRTQWPQFYVHGEEWLAAMPRPQPNKYKRGYWLQHTLCLEDTEHVNAGVVAVDLRKVKQTIFGHVLQHHLAVFNTARHYAQTVEKDVMSGWRRRCLALHLVPLENLRGRIESFALPWKDLVLAFAEWQCNILDLHALMGMETPWPGNASHSVFGMDSLTFHTSRTSPT